MIARILFLAALLVGPSAFAADNATLITPCASGCVTVRSKDVGGLVQSLIQIPGDTSGNPLATVPGTGNTVFALPMQGVAGGVAVPMSAAALPLPTGAATSALQTTGNTALTTINTTLGSPFQAGGSIGNTTFASTQSGAWTVNPTTASTWGLAATTQNVAAPTNGQAVLGEFVTTPTTITSGNFSPLQMDNAGNLLVNIKTGASSGAVAQGSTTSGQTGPLVQCAATTAAPTYTTATTDPLNCDAAGNLRVNVAVAAGTALGTAVSGITGSPILQTGYSAEPTKCTTADTCWSMVDLVGKSVTSPYANRENQIQCAVTITASTAATTCTGMGAQGAGVKIYITDLCVTRNDIGTTADVFTLNDGATTIIDLPNNGGGGGFCHTYNVPLVVAANTAFQGTSGTSITSLHMSATGFKGY